MGKVSFVHKADKLTLATNVTSHLAQSSSSSRFTAGCFGFLLLTQCRDWAGAVGRAEPLRHDAFEAKIGRIQTNL